MLNNDGYLFFQVEKDYERKIATVYLNNPEARNSLTWKFWEELPVLVEELENEENILAVIIAGKGKSFSVGLDLVEFESSFRDILYSQTVESRKKLMDLVIKMQEGFKKIILGKKIYIAAIHKHCYGGALDLAASCDLRVASRDALFSIKETKVGIVADTGSLNRLPRIIGYGRTRLMALTGRDFTAEEAYSMGLVDVVVPTREELLPETLKLATEIAGHPPLVLEGIKKVLLYMEDHTALEGMEYVALWNASFLTNKDFLKILGDFVKKHRKSEHKEGLQHHH